MRRILPGTLEVGKPLQFDYFDASGTLLLRRGNVLQSQKQLEGLIERGLFEKAKESVPRHSNSASTVGQLTNPFDLLNRCRSRLTPLLNQLRSDDPDRDPDGADIDALNAEYRQNIALRCAAPEAKEVMPDGLSLRITEIAMVTQKACRLDPDAALGYVHLNIGERYTTTHPLHCAILIEILGTALELPIEQRQAAIAAALTANIAILNLQERLHRQDSGLTATQQKLLQLHPALSCEMLREAGVADETWLNAVLAHHERFDGSGYPSGIAGEAIPIEARLIAVTDIYDAMIKPRGHRKPLGSREALREIFLKRGARVDELMAKTLIKELSVYPPGSFVRLRNGETAIVFRRGQTATDPLVRSIIGPRGAPLESPIRRNTSETRYVVVDSAERDPSVPVVLDQLWDYRVS